jgi:protein-tyrosine kinase
MARSAPAPRRPASPVCEADPRSPAAEAYRTLRTNLLFSVLSTKGPRILLVSSAVPREGKTTTVANLGVVLAQTGLRVCLIDSDLRRPSLHAQFGLDNDTGLTTALLDKTPVAETARPTRVEKLDLVTSGPVAPNPAELLSSAPMLEFLDGAAAAYDVVVLDSAPVLAVSDASALAPRTHGVVLVVRVRSTPHPAVQRAIEQIESVGGHMAGVLLNAVDLRRDGYFYRYHTYASPYGMPAPGDPR